ncbi:hypothetical protein KC614_04210 [candidate division WWE3 bacterium]|uniref:Uncharacterized protein n=1 Tax=candidate division WWE3 bacterium TaxID=2053526 RepID=A0A955LL35_UNCKA|nr:hypothetical protein [candidate division WWE3 bacterium]
MDGKETHELLFKLYDYADVLADRIRPDDPDSGNYFLTLVFIEKFFDRIGRSEINNTSRNANIDATKSLNVANERIDTLRRRIQTLKEQYDFNDTLEEAGNEIANEWRKN